MLAGPIAFPGEDGHGQRHRRAAQHPPIDRSVVTEPDRSAPSTGVPAADAARERLGDVDEAPLDEHVEVYEDVHRQLQEGLADLDET